MSIPKVVGIEQEYAIQLQGDRSLSAFEASCMLVDAYARKVGLREPAVRMLWDYAHETPYQDIRGKLFRKSPSQQVTTDADNRLINAPLPNGARLYTDHAHPEYSTPECRSARQALACDKAGELILQESIQAVSGIHPDMRIHLYKNNTDHKGHSYGCHENYMMEAAAHERWFVKRPQLTEQVLIPFLVTRQVIAGAGKVGSEGRYAADARYQVSQRADFMENLYGLETTFARPIINTRAEHHADAERFRRLHLIAGDANMCEVAGLVKLGSTQILLQMMEDHYFTEDLSLSDPLKAVRDISMAFDAPVALKDGRTMTAAQIQRRFQESAAAYCQKDSDARVPDSQLILTHWGQILDGLEQLRLSPDFTILDDPEGLIHKLDWLLKLWLLNRYRKGRDDCGWDHPMLQVLDLQYHRVDNPEGMFNRLQKDGVAERVTTDDEIHHFVRHAPEDTRAYFRGRCIEKYPKEIMLLSWEVVAFDHGPIHRMIPLLNPLQGTREQFEGLFADAATSRELISRLEAETGG
jgi:proteasome accessory factor A